MRTLLKLVDSLRLSSTARNLVLCWKRDVARRGFGFPFDVVASVPRVWWSLGILECLCPVFLRCLGGALDIRYCNCCGPSWHPTMNSVRLPVSLEFRILDLGASSKAWLGFLTMHWPTSESLNPDCLFNANITSCSSFVKMNLPKILRVRWFGSRCCSWKYRVLENRFSFVSSHEALLLVTFFASCWLIACLKFWIPLFGDQFEMDLQRVSRKSFSSGPYCCCTELATHYMSLTSQLPEPACLCLLFDGTSR